MQNLLRILLKIAGHIDVHLRRNNGNSATVMKVSVGGHEGIGLLSNWVSESPISRYTTLFRICVDSRRQMVCIKAVWIVCGHCDEFNDRESAPCSNGVFSIAHKSGTLQE